VRWKISQTQPNAKRALSRYWDARAAASLVFRISLAQAGLVQGCVERSETHQRLCPHSSLHRMIRRLSRGLGRDDINVLGCAVAREDGRKRLPRRFHRTAPRRISSATMTEAFGVAFKPRVRAIGIRDRPNSFHSPWQNGYVERLIGSVRRECLDHLIVFNAEHLRRILAKYVIYYNEVRTHVSLGKDAPFPRPIERFGEIGAHPILGGLHHRYARI
jgi:hypothetical protein